MKRVATTVFIGLFWVSSLAWAQSRVPANLDCSPRALKQAEQKYQEIIKPLLATVADEYSGDTEKLRIKERKRAFIFREWMRMHCVCKPPGMSAIERALCHALSESVRVSEADACLMHN